MRLLTLDIPSDAPLHVLCIGAHADDIEIGCGGTVRQLVEQRPGSSVQWWVVTADDNREREARTAAERLLGGTCHLEIAVSRFRDGYIPSQLEAVKDAFNTFRRDSDPDIIFTHTLHDRHQDHRALADLTWNTWRDHFILEYEVPKWEGDLGQPNLYVPLDEASVQSKLDTLLSCFTTQESKLWFDETTFRSLLRLRGVECRASSGYAEAFHARKVAIRL
jgi:LmbE family N-acetylglucosaminyl deacetylase